MANGEHDAHYPRYLQLKPLISRRRPPHSDNHRLGRFDPATLFVADQSVVLLLDGIAKTELQLLIGHGMGAALKASYGDGIGSDTRTRSHRLNPNSIGYLQVGTVSRRHTAFPWDKRKTVARK